MNSRSLQAVLRSLADAPLAGDGELLRRFSGGEEGAFGELVQRHGRLVWAVCRHLSRSDAEADDAFQATFLVLFRNAAKIRDAGRLSAWLHGVAYRVCARARRAAQRRAVRERAAAVSERNGSAVADSAWDRALSAVHEEAGKLPESLRVPFVLCCLEGTGVTEAAAQLGWKLGTLSGRLSRAKDAVLARLEARGLTLGAVAGLGLAAPPPSALARAAALARPGVVVPNAIQQLTQGVIGMSVTSVKMLAAAVLVACGLGVGVGSQWIATADAQTPNKPGQPKGQSKSVSDEELKRQALEARRLAEDLEAALRAQQRGADDLQKQAQKQAEVEKQYLRAIKEVEALVEQEALLKQKGKADAATAKTTRWDYDFVVVSDMDQGKFVKFLQDRENRGWEFNGMTRLRHEGKPTDLWVFRRPSGGAASSYFSQRMQGTGMSSGTATSSAGSSMGPGAGPPPMMGAAQGMRSGGTMPGKQGMSAADDARALEADIARLQEKLAALKRTRTHDRVQVPNKELPLEAAELAEILQKLAAKQFVSGGRFSFKPIPGGLEVDGDREVIDWALTIIKKLREK